MKVPVVRNGALELLQIESAAGQDNQRCDSDPHAQHVAHRDFKAVILWGYHLEAPHQTTCQIAKDHFDSEGDNDDAEYQPQRRDTGVYENA